MPRRVTAVVFALIALVAACTGGPGPTPSPTTPPGPTPAPTPTPSPTFGPNDIEHPTGPNDVVLRLEQGGGLVPMNFFFTQAPQFTLYGDGTVILRPIDTRMSDPVGGQAFLPWVVGHLDETQVQALLQYALTTGRLANAREQYDNPMIADAGSTIFTINAAGIQKTVNIYALMEVTDPTQPDAIERQGFSQLAAVLNDFQGQSGVDLGQVGPYDPSHYKLSAMAGFGQPPVQPMAWPWDKELWTSWKPDPDTGNRQGVLARDQVSKLLAVPNGGHAGVWVTAPDETVVSVAVRPMLPEEIDAFLHGGG